MLSYFSFPSSGESTLKGENWLLENHVNISFDIPKMERFDHVS